MSSRLVLGPVTFNDFEVPARIQWGGKQRLRTHELLGGGRVVDKLGYAPHDIRWEGRFRGSRATSRARLLETLTARGGQLPLTWGGLFHLVVIESFDPDYHRAFEIPYKISCRVVTGGVGIGGGLSGLLPSLSSLISSDVGRIVSLAQGVR